MGALVVVGAQWGDEGKGKITDFLAGSAGAVVRYQGGNNAGHTVIVGEEKYKLHLIPSGILYKARTCILGNGVVIDLPALVGELAELAARGVDTSGLHISAAAHVILAHHKAQDAAQEEAMGASQIGTTRRGIGPAYKDKVNRVGIRVGDLEHPRTLREKLERLAALQGEKAPRLDVEAELAAQTAAFAHLRAHVVDTTELINRFLDRRERVLFEGAQGTFLDLDHGTFPFVTSSTPTAGGACVGSGVGPTRIDRVIGVAKAYSTRVGAGPFPTECTDAVGEALVTRGAEFGTTTGRRRRAGWLDLPMLRRAVRINDLWGLAITKLDVLDDLPQIELAVDYTLDGERLSGFPADLPALLRARPVYERLPGWCSSTADVREVSRLPANARRYLDRIEEATGVPVAIVSVGAERTTTIVVKEPWDGL